MKTNIHTLTINGFLVSIFLLFTLIPWIGYLPLGAFKITLMPILFLISLDVLQQRTKINSIITGIGYGCLFGCSSLIQAALYPSPTAFIFINPLFSIVPRILMGAIVGTFAFLTKKIANKTFGKKLFLTFITITSNTFFVVIFVKELGPVIYQEQNEIIFSFFSWSILITNYLPELILTNLIYPPIALAIKRIS